MNNLNPVDNDLAKYIKSLETRLKAIETSKQPFLGDWVLIGNRVQYVSANSISFTDATLDFGNFFAIGDPVRWLQTGDLDYRYGYVVSISATLLGIQAGTDYVVANSTITEFSRGIKLNPTGFPFTFNYTAGYADPGSQLSSINIIKSQFWMQGTTMTIDLHFDDGNLASGITSIYFLLPVIPANIYDVAFLPCVGLNNNKIQTAAIRLDGAPTIFGGNDYYADAILIANPGTGGTGFDTWVTSTGGVGLDATFTYVIAI